MPLPQEGALLVSLFNLRSTATVAAATAVLPRRLVFFVAVRSGCPRRIKLGCLEPGRGWLTWEVTAWEIDSPAKRRAVGGGRGGCNSGRVGELCQGVGGLCEMAFLEVQFPMMVPLRSPR